MLSLGVAHAPNRQREAAPSRRPPREFRTQDSERHWQCRSKLREKGWAPSEGQADFSYQAVQLAHHVMLGSLCSGIQLDLCNGEKGTTGHQAAKSGHWTDAETRSVCKPPDPLVA
jgi:hypothetical protein